MSCQIKQFANISDLVAVRRYLFPSDDDRGSDNWLYNCLMSVSPTGELITFTSKNRIVVLTAKWDSNAVLNQYHISYTGTLDTEPITSVLCLPIASQSQNSQVGPDWTCIVVGLQNGEVKFYTEDCSLLLMERFHDERVNSVKCQSHHVSNVDAGSDVCREELYIQYSKCICVLNGIHLFPILRNIRSQLARVQAQGDSLDPTSHMLFHKKWGLFDQFEINDVSVVGLDNNSNTFNNLLTASICGGFDTKYRAVVPNNTLIIGAGTKPYVGFHYAFEGGMQPLLSDVAKAVAHRVKAALPGWLVGDKVPVKKPATAMQPAEAVACRFGLCDIRRVADFVVMSPNKKLSAVIDSLGRIVLIDNFRGVIVRMWKGYRGSQCAFLQVPDEERNRQKSSSKKRLALFLIIYTPKKGTIEIWAMQQGPKIVTFSASKNAKLIYINYGLMGTGNVPLKNKYNIEINCILMDPDGQIKEIIVPFHFALTEKNSKRARDVHLYKQLKQFIKSEEFNVKKLCTQVSLVCSELKTNEIRQQCLEMLISNKHIHPDALLTMADCFLEKLEMLDLADNDISRLVTLCQKLKLLVHFYVFIDGNYDIDAENGNVANNNENDQEEEQEVHRPDTRLLIAEKDMNNLQRLLDLSTINDERKSSEIKVKFHEENKSIFNEYLSVFNISDPKQITLKKDVADDKLYRVADKIFKSFIQKERKDVEEFKEHMIRSQIRALDLIKMILNFWVNRSLTINVNLEKEMQNLSRILHMICLTSGNENLCVDYNKISPFWTEIRDYLADSAKPFPALTAAILCRSVAQRIEQEKEAQQCSATSLDDEANTDIWEKLSQENCQWTLLIGKLEDVSILNIILSNKPLCDAQPLPKLYYDPTNISLKYILQKGKGAVSELVAQWLTSGGISPEFIVCNEICNIPNEPDVNEASSRPESVEISVPPNPALLQKNLNVNQPVFEHINMLKKQFPYSLDSSSILANMSWEYALTWQKDIQKLLYLEAMAKCLQHISNAHLKQGLYNMVWTTHLKQTFESTCKLVNKVGKVPKEILCRQDTGLTDLQLPIYIEFCTNFLDQFMDALQQCYGTEKQTQQFENLWENGGNSLTELALQQSEINDSLLHIHYQLSLVIQVITTFGIKQLKPVVNLFDSFTITNFFTDLSQNMQINTYSSEPKLLRTRTQFLIKVINSSIETVRVSDEGVYSQDHVNWMSKCVSLASVWGIDTDLLRRQQVLLLYTNGLNDLADEILPSIENTEALGTDMLAIAGKQLKLLLMSSEDLMEKVVALSPALTQYLDTLDKSWCAPGTLDTIINLAEHCVRSISETNSCYRQASSLLDACLTLREMNS